MKILLTPKINPDIDGIACAYAYHKLLIRQSPNYTAIIYGKPHIEAQYVIDRFNINDIQFNSNEYFDRFILCDASDLTGMPNVFQKKDVIEVIDHRESYSTSEQFPNATLVIELVGAAATLITEKYMKSNVEIDFNSAILLYGAIFSNTLNLRGSVTTQRDINATKWIESKIHIPKNFIKEMFQAKTDRLLKNLEETFTNDSKEFEFNDIRFGISQLEVCNAKTLLDKKQNQIFDLLDKLKKQQNLSFNFLTIADVDHESNIFITKDMRAQEILGGSFNVIFSDSIAFYNKLILRKQIVPKLRELL